MPVLVEIQVRQLANDKLIQVNPANVVFVQEGEDETSILIFVNDGRVTVKGSLNEVARKLDY